MKRTRAFTLIELMFVVVVMTMLASITIPKISSITGINLRTGATDISGYLRAAREEAVLRHQRLRVTFDLANGSYWAETYSPLPGPDLFGPETNIEDAIKKFEEELSRPAPSEEDAAKLEKERYSKFETETLKGRTLPSEIRFKGVYVAALDQVVADGTPSIEFSPGGYTAKTVVYISNDRDEVFSIALSPVGGKTRTEKGEIAANEL